MKVQRSMKSNSTLASGIHTQLALNLFVKSDSHYKGEFQTRVNS